MVVLFVCSACGDAEMAAPPSTTTPPTMSVGEAVLVPRPALTSLPPKSCDPAPSATVQAIPAPLIPRVAREPLTPEGTAAGSELAAKIRPVLERVCASGDFSVETTRKALADQAARVFRADEQITGVAFVVAVPSACVLGELRPGHLRISVEGPTRTGHCE